MSKIQDFFRRIKSERKYGRRSCRYTDPSTGIEYNKINIQYRVTVKIWDFDLARTPEVISDFNSHINVHGEAYKANSHRGMIDFKRSKAYGRGR